ncbi:hypothetical protein J3R83DRAFT_9256 [Lanmaoa asiatica]|nr:hypothetical protein J3R83DRAFT_9256 [Lanmaoa asiatica]
MVQITPLLNAIPVLSWLVSVTPPNSASNGLAVRQTIDPNGIPAACQPSCQVEYTIANCAGSSQLHVRQHGRQSVAAMRELSRQHRPHRCSITHQRLEFALRWQLVFGGADESAFTMFSSGGGTTSGTTSGGTTTTGGTTGGTIPATTTGTSSSSGSVPSSTSTGGAVDLEIGSMTMCIVAALAGAFKFL